MVKNRFRTHIRHDQIAPAALSVINQAGLKGLNVAAVAKRVDLVPSAVYRHRKNAWELFSAAIEKANS